MSFLRAFQQTGYDLYAQGMNNTHSGNLSIRNNRMMTITRSGSMLHRLEFNDLIETVINGEDSESAKASREIPVHRSIYNNTPAQAIAHSHPPHIIALSMLTNQIRPIDAEGSYFFSRGIKVTSVDNPIASEEVGAKILTELDRYPLAVVKGHGVFSIGENLEECLHWTSSLEHSAKIILLKNQFAINSNLT
ncbi:MAG: class II aldolase/adducin family protein [Candidatus Rifleibacteriota bacterium]